MKFFDNRIVNPTGNGPSFDEWVAREILKTAETVETEKVAAEAKPECDDDPRGQCRGQVINNDPLYQKGESVDGKPEQKESKAKQAHCAKEMGESSKAGDVTEKHAPAANADEKGQVEQDINNDPNYQKGESTDPGKITGKNKKGPDDKVTSKKSTNASKFKKVAALNRTDKLRLFAVLAAQKNNPLQYVEAMTGLKFANLTEDEKNYLRKFWNILYPRKYVEDMIKDR